MLIHFYAGADADMKHLCGHADTPPTEQGGCCTPHWHRVTCPDCLKMKEKMARIITETDDGDDCLQCDLETLKDPQAQEIEDLKLRLNQMSVNCNFLMNQIDQCSNLLNLNGTWQQRAEALHGAIKTLLEDSNV